MVVVVKN